MKNEQVSVEEVKQALLINPDINLWDKMELVQSRNLEAVEIIKRIAREQLLQQEKETKLIEAIEIVCQALREDKDYYKDWESKLTECIYDEICMNPAYYMDENNWKQISNDAAHNFLKLLTKCNS